MMSPSSHTQRQNAKQSISLYTGTAMSGSSRDYNASACPFQTCDICKNLANVDEKILKAQNMLVRLSKKRQEIKELINSRHDQLISREPTEIISLVFCFAVQDNDGVCYQGSQWPLTWNPAVLLSAVSKDWRKITLGTPQLWTTVVIDLWKDSARPGIARDWLYRSCTLPLSITFRGSRDAYEDVIDPGPKAQQVFKAHSTRWKNVAFEVPVNKLHGLLNNIQGAHQVDSLRFEPLKNCFSDRSTSTNPIQMPEAFHPRTLHARNCLLDHIPIQWDNLTRIDVSHFCLDELLHIICHATRLIQCKAENVISRSLPIYALPLNLIVNPTLSHIITEYATSSHGFLRYITLPSLKNFEYSYDSFEDSLPVISSFLKRSGVPQCFAFSYWIDEPVISYLDLPSQITDLKLAVRRMEGSSRADDFLKLLAEDRDTVFLLPNIRTLQIDTDIMTPTFWSALASVFPTTQPAHHQVQGFQESSSSTSTIDIALPDSEFTIRRPWVKLTVETRATLSPSNMMDKETFARLLDIRKSGVEVDLRDIRGVNLLQLAAEHHAEAS